MKWFKHDSSAHRDAKLKRLRLKYGITGYGLYWYCLELIAEGVDSKKHTFELEDDAELIANEWSLEVKEVAAMMEYMVDIGLFVTSPDTNRIVCLKLANRLDESASKNPEIRAAVRAIRDAGFMSISGTLPESLPIAAGAEEIRLDKTRLEKDLRTPTDHEMVIDLYHEILPTLRKVTKSRWLGSARATHLNKRWHENKKFQSEEFWRAFFETVSENPWWMGENDRNWKANLEWLVKRSNFDKVIDRGLDS